MESLGKLFISIGLIMIFLGGVFVLGEKIGLGKMPGDIFIQKENFTLAFPIVSSLIISIILTIVLNLLRK